MVYPTRLLADADLNFLHGSSSRLRGIDRHGSADSAIERRSQALPPIAAAADHCLRRPPLSAVADMVPPHARRRRQHDRARGNGDLGYVIRKNLAVTNRFWPGRGTRYMPTRGFTRIR
jgi:hypothetical protein